MAAVWQGRRFVVRFLALLPGRILNMYQNESHKITTKVSLLPRFTENVGSYYSKVYIIQGKAQHT